jgi:hypothetical protein
MSKTTNEQLKVRVFNDGEKVFEGTLKEFVYINEYDEETMDFVHELAGRNSYEQEFFHSGHWRIERA